jgi:hypothetical protein
MAEEFPPSLTATLKGKGDGGIRRRHHYEARVAIAAMAETAPRPPLWISRLRLILTRCSIQQSQNQRRINNAC